MKQKGRVDVYAAGDGLLPPSVPLWAADEEERGRGRNRKGGGGRSVGRKKNEKGRRREMKGTDVEGGAGAAVAHGRRERKEQRRREGSDGMKKMVRSEMCV